MGEYELVKIVKSSSPGHKLDAVFRNKKTGKESRTPFGKSGMSDYTKHKDKERRKRYRIRHKKDLKTNDPTRAGYLSYYILWGESTSLRDNIAAYKRRFFPGSSEGKKKMSSPKPSENTGLRRWLKEKWTDEKGNVCGSKKNKKIKKCRPSIRVNKGTPRTWGEMTPSEKKEAVKKKKEVGMGRRAPSIKKKKNSPSIRMNSRGTGARSGSSSGSSIGSRMGSRTSYGTGYSSGSRAGYVTGYSPGSRLGPSVRSGRSRIRRKSNSLDSKLKHIKNKIKKKNKTSALIGKYLKNKKKGSPINKKKKLKIKKKLNKKKLNKKKLNKKKLKSPAVPSNPKLYKEIKEKVKNKVKSSGKTWPSAYGSMELVRTYKAAGGKYK